MYRSYFVPVITMNCIEKLLAILLILIVSHNAWAQLENDYEENEGYNVSIRSHYTEDELYKGQVFDEADLVKKRYKGRYTQETYRSGILSGSITTNKEAKDKNETQSFFYKSEDLSDQAEGYSNPVTGVGSVTITDPDPSDAGVPPPPDPPDLPINSHLIFLICGGLALGTLSIVKRYLHNG